LFERYREAQMRLDVTIKYVHARVACAIVNINFAIDTSISIDAFTGVNSACLLAHAVNARVRIAGVMRCFTM